MAILHGRLHPGENDWQGEKSVKDEMGHRGRMGRMGGAGQMPAPIAQADWLMGNEPNKIFLSP
jgi:hypothetical protein